MKLLFVLPCPWSKKFGQARASIGLAEELEKAGHFCDRFTIADCKSYSNHHLNTLFGIRRFQRQIRDRIRAVGSQYDVVQVEHNLIAYSRESYRFSGVLISKSVGLAHLYQAYEREYELRIRRMNQDRGRLLGRILRGAGRILQGGIPLVERGFDVADQIHLNNTDEFEFIRSNPKWSAKAALVTSGISEAERFRLASGCKVEIRLLNREVVSIGHWSYRKGKQELPKIVRAIRLRQPLVRFHLLGTGESENNVRACFAEADRDSIRVTPEFDPQNLSALLANARLGLFVSYIEGFPFGCIEMLAAGLPVVAWDVPGPREMLKRMRLNVLTPCGSIEETAQRILQLFNLSREEFSRESLIAAQIAEFFSWSNSARQFFQLFKNQPL